MLVCFFVAVAMAVPCGALLAAAPLDLGTAANFGALAGGAISGTGNVKGDVGSGTGAIAPAITSTGTIYPSADAVATTALEDFTAAYNEGKSRTHDVLLSGAAYELGGKTLTPGVYKIGAAATIATPVILNAGGNPDAVFIIQIAGALGTTASTGNVVLTNGARAANVFWIVDGAVSMGASSHMEGNMLGGAAVALGASTTVNGRVLAGSAAGTIAMSTEISVPVDPSVIGDRVWFDANGNQIQDPDETIGFPGVPVTLLQAVLEKVAIDLGTAADFGALAGAAISGSGEVAGDVGSGTGAIAPAVTATGTKYPTGHAAAEAALDDFATAYDDGKNRTPDVVLSAAAFELGGSILTPGVYKIGAAATLASAMTLDAGGDPEAVFIIQITGAFGTTAATGNVNLANQAKSANVFWIVEGAVSVGANSHMEGNILGGAAITLGASTTMSGRALAGTAAGTIALANTVSPVTGTPPAGFPPPIVAGETVTDSNGNYLFEGVPPGTYTVRWDLSEISTDYRITTAKQGDDDELDSDSASGEVGGFVDSVEIVVLGGTIHRGVDLGLIETLPAIKTAAIAELAAARIAHLLANSYTAENWDALRDAETDGETAINEATDAAGVANRKNSALDAMEAVPTYAETLAAAKAPALDELTTTLATYTQGDYTPASWAALNEAKTQGDAAINAATYPSEVAAAEETALDAMDAVPTIAETLAAAKLAAISELAATLAAYLEANPLTAEEWTALTNARTDGENEINAATDPAGVTSAEEAALAAMGAVLAISDTPVITSISRASDGEVTLVLATTPNVLLTIQTSTGLSNPAAWTTIATATPATGSWSFVHAPALATGPKRFYRAFLTP